MVKPKGGVHRPDIALEDPRGEHARGLTADVGAGEQAAPRRVHDLVLPVRRRPSGHAVRRDEVAHHARLRGRVGGRAAEHGDARCRHRFELAGGNCRRCRQVHRAERDCRRYREGQLGRGHSRSSGRRRGRVRQWASRSRPCPAHAGDACGHADADHEGDQDLAHTAQRSQTRVH